MRQAFAQTLTQLAIDNPETLLISGDLGFKVFDEFRAKCPQQFLNAGIAESHMVGMATGLSMEGKLPFVYSIAPFLVMRTFEQIRNDICFHQANVKLIGVGGGFSYGPNGTSHHALNDVALMRLLPEMTVMTPGDPQEAQLTVQVAHAHKGPVYIRLGRGQDEIVHTNKINLLLGRAIRMREGHDIGIIVSGVMLKTAVTVTNALQNKGLSVSLISMPTIKPLDTAAVTDILKVCAKVFTLEEHSVIGGLGDAVLAYAHTQGLPTNKLHCLGVPDQTIHEIGSQEYLRRRAGLNVEQILERIHANR